MKRVAPLSELEQSILNRLRKSGGNAIPTDRLFAEEPCTASQAVVRSRVLRRLERRGLVRLFVHRSARANERVGLVYLSSNVGQATAAVPTKAAETLAAELPPADGLAELLRDAERLRADVFRQRGLIDGKVPFGTSGPAELFDHAARNLIDSLKTRLRSRAAVA
jgi:hypothetical protein